MTVIIRNMTSHDDLLGHRSQSASDHEKKEDKPFMHICDLLAAKVRTFPQFRNTHK